MSRRSARRSHASDHPATNDVQVLLGDEPVDGEGGRPAHSIDAWRLELIERIVAEYDVDSERAAEGADLYLRQLRRGSLLAEY